MRDDATDSRGNSFKVSFLSNPLGKSSVRWAAAVLSGLFLAASFPKLEWNELVWVACLPLLAALVHETRAGRAFLLAYASGAVFLAGGCYWFVGVMERYGGLSPALALGAMALFVAVFSAFFGGFGLAVGWAARRSPGVALALSPFLWVAMELARTYLITGFPWNLLGYAVPAEGLRQLATVTGVYGLSFLAVATSALLLWVALKPQAALTWAALTGWVALLILTQRALFPPILPHGPNRAFLLQPNVPLDEWVLESWEPWRDPARLNQLVNMTLAAVTAQDNPSSPAPAEAVSSSAPPLIVWAENPAPFYFTRDPVFRSAVESMARQAHAVVIVNTVNFLGPGNDRATNSAVILDPSGRLLLTYDKIHLVPFGEYVPAWAFPGLVGKITSGVGSYVPGWGYRGARTPEGTIGVFICYEAIFPQLVRSLVQAGAGVLVNISNDTWFGDSAAGWQHLEMARLRALENRRYLLRATNDGITAVIDPYGRVVAEAPRHQARVLPGRFAYRSGRTFYTAHGDLFAWLCVGVAAALIIMAALYGRPPREAR